MTIDRQILQQFLDNMIVLYQKANEDVWKINAIEYSLHAPTHSVLGEVEIISDNIAGIVSQCKNGLPNDVSWMEKQLENSTLFKNDHIIDWIKNSSSTYEAYFRYLQSVEFLRAALLRYIQEN